MSMENIDKAALFMSLAIAVITGQKQAASVATDADPYPTEQPCKRITISALYGEKLF